MPAADVAMVSNRCEKQRCFSLISLMFLMRVPSLS
jgi:hypothetical protein